MMGAAGWHYRSMTAYLVHPVDLGCFLPFWEASAVERLGTIPHHKISFRNACVVTFSFKIAGLVVWNRCLRDAIIPWPKLLMTYHNHSPSRPPLFLQMNHFQHSAFVLLPHVIIPENNLSSSK